MMMMMMTAMNDDDDVDDDDDGDEINIFRECIHILIIYRAGASCIPPGRPGSS